MGAERRSEVVRGCVRPVNQVPAWGESRERAEVTRQAVRGLEPGCLGGVGEGQGVPQWRCAVPHALLAVCKAVRADHGLRLARPG